MSPPVPSSLLLLLIATALAATNAYRARPRALEQGLFYRTYDLSRAGHFHRNLTRHLAGPWSWGDKTVVERPYQGSIPGDSGRNYGDIVFSSDRVRKNGTLLTRDTIINTRADRDLLIVYERRFPGVYLEDFQFLNFGRQRGYARTAEVYHESGYVVGEILVPTGKFVRIFAESYARSGD